MQNEIKSTNLLDNSKRLSLPYVILFFLLAVPFFASTAWHYVVIFASMLLLIIFGVKPRISLHNKIDIIPILFIFVWAVGIVVGITSGNEKRYIVANFAGMTLYSLFYFLRNARIDVNKICKVFYYASIVLSIEIVICFLLHRNGLSVPWPLNNIRYLPFAHTIYSVYVCSCFVVLGISFWEIFHPSKIRNRLANIFLFSIASLAIIWTTDSGGFFLAYIFIIFPLLILNIITNKKSAIISFAAVCFLSFLTLFSLYIESKTGIFSNIFSAYSSGNSKRWFQLQLVMERFQIIGNGLGAIFDYSGGNDYDMYGIEVSYLNLIDKFGLFSLPLFIAYAYSMFMPLWLINKKKENRKYNIISFTLMGYFLVAVGNPIIFAPYCVILHIFSLLITSHTVRNYYSEKK